MIEIEYTEDFVEGLVTYDVPDEPKKECGRYIENCGLEEMFVDPEYKIEWKGPSMYPLITFYNSMCEHFLKAGMFGQIVTYQEILKWMSNEPRYAKLFQNWHPNYTYNPYLTFNMSKLWRLGAIRKFRKRAAIKTKRGRGGSVGVAFYIWEPGDAIENIRRNKREPVVKEKSDYAKLIYDAVIAYKKANDGNSPTIRAICDATGIPSTATVYRYLNAMKAKGLVDIVDKKVVVIGGTWQIGNS